MGVRREERMAQATAQRSLDNWYAERGSRDMSAPPANTNHNPCTTCGRPSFSRGRYCADCFPKVIS